jgi:hypothetical protein
LERDGAEILRSTYKFRNPILFFNIQFDPKIAGDSVRNSHLGESFCKFVIWILEPRAFYVNVLVEICEAEK